MCVGWWTPGLSKQECRLVKLVTHQTPRRELWHFALAGEVCFKWKKCDFCYCTLVLVKNVQNVIFRSEFEKLSAVVVVLSEFMMRDLCEIAKIAECFLFSYPARKWTLEESTEHMLVLITHILELLFWNKSRWLEYFMPDWISDITSRLQCSIPINALCIVIFCK